MGLPDADVRPPVLERLRPWLPALLALTGNSPLWRGMDTGWSSHRFALQRRRAALLPARVPTLVPVPRRTGAVGNIEIRLADSALSVPDAVLLAGLCRALVGTAIDDELAGRPSPEVPDRVLVAVARAAARRGMAALVVSPGRAGLAPAGEVLDELMTAVEPALERSGDTCHLSDLLADRLGGDRVHSTSAHCGGSVGPSRSCRRSRTSAPASTRTSDRRPAHPAAVRRLMSRHCVGLMPNRWRNHRENALGAVNPSSSETSVRVYRSFAR